MTSLAITYSGMARWSDWICSFTLAPLAALSLAKGSERAQTQLNLHWNGLKWLLNPFSGLVPDVDRAQ